MATSAIGVNADDVPAPDTVTFDSSAADISAPDVPCAGTATVGEIARSARPWRRAPVRAGAPRRVRGGERSVLGLCPPAGDLLELAATEGLNLKAVGLTRLRVGEGIVGLCAAQGAVMNLPDAQNHPAFAYRPETGEEPFASMLAVPVRRSGRVLGVLTVQNRMPRHFTGQEVDELETVAMLLAEMLPATSATEAVGEGLPSTVPRVFAGTTLMTGIAIGPVVLHGTRLTGIKLLAEDPERELQRLADAADRMQRGIDDLLAGVPSDASTSRDVLEAYRLVAIPVIRVVPAKTRGTVLGRPSPTASVALLAGSISASSMATVSNSSTSRPVKCRGRRFCTVSTPSTRPERRTGTASMEANGSSPVSGR